MQRDAERERHIKLTPKNSLSPGGKHSRANSMKKAEPYGKVSELSVLDRTLTIVEKRALRLVANNVGVLKKLVISYVAFEAL